MRIGVFGGSFDPPHTGHLIVAEAVADVLSLDRVHFVPACEQPFKRTKLVASPEDRAEMVGLAVEGNPRFVQDLREIRRGGVSYTVDTLRSIRQHHRTDELFLLVGADAAKVIGEWKDGPALTQLACIVALTRLGTESVEHELISRVIEVPRVDISATQVRRAVCEGRSIRYLVPHAVAQYIEAHGLYRADNYGSDPRMTDD